MNGQYVFGNCMNYLPDYDDNHFDLAIVDTPFGIQQDGRKKRPRTVKQKNGKVLRMKKQFKDSHWDDKQPEQSYFDELFRVSKYQIIMGCNYIQFDQKKTSSGRIVWNKLNYNNHFSDCEIFWTNLFSSVRLVEYMWSGMMQGKSLKHPRVQQGNKKLNEKRIQCTQKPTLLYRWMLRLKEVKPEWKLLDTHVGSASSLIAFEQEGFQDYVGIEKDPLHYCNSDTRVKNYLSQLKLEL